MSSQNCGIFYIFCFKQEYNRIKISIDLKLDDCFEKLEYLDEYRENSPLMLYYLDYPPNDSKPKIRFLLSDQNQGINLSSEKLRIDCSMSNFIYEIDVDDLERYQVPITLTDKVRLFAAYLKKIQHMAKDDPMKIDFIQATFNLIDKKLRQEGKIESGVVFYILVEVYAYAKIAILLEKIDIESLELTPKEIINPRHFEGVLKICEKFGDKILKDNCKTNYGAMKQKLLQLIIYFYKNYNQETLVTYLTQKEPRLARIDFFLLTRKLTLFRGIDLDKLNQLCTFYESCGCFTDFSRVIDFLKLSKNLVDLLGLISKNLEIIKKYSQTISKINAGTDTDLKLAINKDSFLLNVEPKNLVVLFRSFEDFKNLTKEDETLASLLEFDNEIWRDVINRFTRVSVQMLEYIREQLSKIYDQSDYEEYFEEYLGDAIHETIVNSIRSDNLKGTKLLEMIKKDKIYQRYRKLDLWNTGYEEFLSTLELDVADDTLIKIFKEIRFQEVLEKEDYIKFLEIILGKITEFKTMDTINTIFGIENISQNSSVKKIIFEKFKELLEGNSNKDNTKICEYIKLFSKVLGRVDIVEILNLLENKFEDKEVCFIYKNVIKTITNEFEGLSEQLVKFLLKSLDNPKETKIVELIDNLEHDDLPMSKKRNLIALFNNLSNYIIQSEDFYNKDESANFKLYDNINTKNYLQRNNYLQSSSYFMLIKNNFQKFRKEVENLDINCVNAAQILATKEDRLIHKLSLLYNNKQNEAKATWDKIKDEVKTAVNLMRNIIIVNKYGTYFYKENDTYIKKYEKMNYIINTKKLNEFKNYKKNFQDLGDEVAIAKNYVKLIETISFDVIYTNISQSTQMSFENRQKKAKEEFQHLRDLLDRNRFKSFLDNKKTMMNQVLIRLKTPENINKELTLLKNIFGVTSDTSELLSNLKILANKQYIIEIINGILYLIKEKGGNSTNYSSTLKEILRQSQGDPSLDELKQVKNKLKNLNIDLDKEELYLVTLIKLSQRQEMMQFVQKKTEAQVKNIGESLNEVDDSFVNQTDIIELSKVVKFKDIFNREVQKNKDDSKIVEVYKWLFEKTKGIEASFESVLNNLNSLINLEEKVGEISMNSRSRLLQLASESSFLIEPDKENIEKLNCISGGVKLDDIISIRDKVLLKNNKNDNMFESTIIPFSNILNDINTLVGHLQKLNQLGDPKDMTYKINIKNNIISYSSRNGEYKGKDLTNLKDLIAIFSEREHILEKLQLAFYARFEEITFLSGKHFSILYNYLKFNKNFKLRSLFKLLTKNKFKEEAYISIDNLEQQHNNYLIRNIKDININQNNKDLLEMLNACNLYIVHTYQSLNIKGISQIYQESFIQSSIKLDDCLYSKLISNRDLETDIISTVKTITGNGPIPQTFLICNDKTTKEEIVAFLYRVYHCKDHVLFCLLQPENLQVKVSYELGQEIERMFTGEKGKFRSVLLILYVSQSSSIINHIRNLSCHHYLQIDIQKKEIDFNNIQIVDSNASGLGKSYYIQKQIKNNEEYIYFPIGGEFDRDDILLRLNKFKFKEGNTLIHIDISETEHIDLMRNFLFSFLVLHYYSACEKVFYYGNDITIKIEIPCGFTDYYKTFPILDLFKNRYKILKEKLNEFSKLEVPQDLNSDIQIVCNHLDNYDKGENANFILEFPVNSAKIPKEDRNGGYVKKARLYSQDEAEKLIDKYFPPEKGTHNTYYQKRAFINILANQFRIYQENIFFSVELLKSNGSAQGKPNLNLYRNNIFEAILDITKHFTKGAYGDLVVSQATSYMVQNSEQAKEEALKKGIEELANKKVNSFVDIKTLVFFNYDYQSFTIVSTLPKDSDGYKKLYDLWNFQIPNSAKYKPLRDYLNFKEQNEFFADIKSLLNINKNKIDIKDKNGQIVTKTIPEIVNNYVFTMDNYIKMILILLRIRANIPVIMMGETGCGKTSLIKIISKLKGNVMLTLNIHAGVGDDEIIKFLSDNKLFQSQGPSKEEIWVFLDEINTCNSMGLISEMMCKRTAKGRSIKKNVVFIAACNPYRTVTSKNDEIVGLIRDKHKVRNLVYTVYPLPHSLLNFVFDFGNLTSKDEINYIKSMIRIPMNESVNKFYQDGDKGNLSQDIQNIAQEAITQSQTFIRSKCDISSVSLRDVRRFSVLYKWFVKYLFKKQAYEKNKQNEKQNLYSSRTKSFIYQDTKQIFYDSIKLTIFICYYLRITKKDIRNEFAKDLESKVFKGEKFKEVPEREMNYLAEQVTPEPGIAKNNALLENLFTLFVCVNKKIPVFICGKPGCSKSLSVKLLFKSMRGKLSDNDFFKQFASINMFCYEGSETSTSEGVLKVFNKARNAVKSMKAKAKEKREKTIVMIFFDEMGLAEISKSNPLKVIHSQLEYDENEDKLAFVGISNWVLDASKMNRGIFLSIPEPDKDDLIKTSLTIAESYGNGLIQKESYTTLFTNLAEVYKEYKDSIKGTKYEDYHGARDFYHLTKIACRRILKEEGIVKDDILVQFGEESLERNFGGIGEANLDSILKVKGLLKPKYPTIKISNTYEIKKCIVANVEDIKSRYLLVTTKTDISHFIIQAILKEVNKFESSQMFIGSNFESDINEEFYKADLINKIQTCMESGKIIILKNLSSLYPTLYDLFNQNFTKVHGKNFARITSGSESNLCLVDDNFRVIVLMDDKQILTVDPPFLNRFEKHILSFDYLLNESENKVAKEIKDYLTLIVKYKTPSGKFKVNLAEQLINCDIEEIKGIFYKLKISQNEQQNANLRVLDQLIPLFTQDIMSQINNSDLIKKPQITKYIIDQYKLLKNHSLSEYLGNVKEKKCIVFTFSSIMSKIQVEGISNKSLNMSLTKESTTELFVSEILNERQLDIYVDKFYQDQSKKLIIFKFLPNQTIHMNHFKTLIENYENMKEKKDIKDKKMFLFVVYLIRKFNFGPKLDQEEEEKNKLYQEGLISHLGNFDQIFIDNLSGKNDNILNYTNISVKENLPLYKKKELIDTLKIMRENLYSSFSKIKYNFKNELTGFKADDYIDKIIGELLKKENEKFLSTLNDVVLKQTNNEKKVFQNLLIEDESIFEDNPNSEFIVYLKNFLKKKYADLLDRVIIQCEQHNLLYPMLFGKGKNNKDISDLFSKVANNFKISTDKMKIKGINGNDIAITLGLSVPDINKVLKPITDCINKFKVDYYNYEVDIRHLNSNDKDYETFFAETKTKIESTENDIYVEFERSETLKKLIEFSENNKLDKETPSLIRFDYFFIFISKTFNKNIEILSRILNLLVEQRFKSAKGLPEFQKLAKYFLWIESNSDSIIKVLSICDQLSKYINNIDQEIDKIIKSGDIQYKLPKNKPAYLEDINKTFYNVLESSLKLCMNQNELFEFKDQKGFDYINTLKSILQISSQLETSLILNSKELFSLNIFIKGYELLIKTGENSINNVKEFVKLLNKETELYKNLGIDVNEDSFGNEDKVIDCLKEQISFLKKKLNVNDYGNLVISLLKSKYKQTQNKTLRMEMLKIIFSENTLILKSKNFIMQLFSNLNIIPDLNQLIDKDDRLRELSQENLDKLNDEFIPFLKVEDLLIIELNKEIIPKEDPKKNSTILNDILLYYFEIELTSFFSILCKCSKNSEENAEQGLKKYMELLKGLLLNFFKTAVEFVEGVINGTDKEGDDTRRLIHLSSLYAFAYIKCYLKEYIKLAADDKKTQMLGDTTDFNSIMENNSQFKLVLKIFILKILREKEGSYEKLRAFNFDKYQLKFLTDLDYSEKVVSAIDYLFFDYDNASIFEEEQNSFVVRNNNSLTQLIEQYGRNGQIAFFDIILNKVIATSSNLNDYFSKNDLKLFSEIMQNYINNTSISNEARKLLTLMSNKNQFDSTLKSLYTQKLKNDAKNLEMFMNLYKISFISASAQSNSFYHKLYTNDVCNTINNNFVPGGESEDDIFSESYEQIQAFFTSSGVCDSAYMCDCGLCYFLTPCGYPWDLDKCKKCGKDIGPVNNHGSPIHHELVKRKNHYRVYKDFYFKQESEKHYGVHNEDRVPYIFMSELEDIIKERRKNQKKGIQKLSYYYFKKTTNKFIRNMDAVTYRFLSLVLYTNLYFSLLLKYVTKDQLAQTNVLPILEVKAQQGKGTTTSIIDAIECVLFNWKTFEDELKKKKIDNIHIFLNEIFPQFAKLVNDSASNFSSMNNRDDFEKKVNDLINTSIAKYSEYKEKYKGKNSTLLSTNPNSLKSIIHEINDPNYYKQDNYPYLKYFMMSVIPTEEILYNKLKEIENTVKLYPVINNYFDRVDSFNYLRNFKYINPFLMALMSQYNYKITRGDAKKLKIKAELDKIGDENLNLLLEDFKRGWPEVMDQAIKYKCKPQMKPINLADISDDRLCVANYLNDDGELNFGMYLAAFYYNCTIFQNEFITGITNNLSETSPLYYYKEQLEKKIVIQDASENEIINNRIGVETSDFGSITDMLTVYSSRDCYNDDGTINYNTYKNIEYDFKGLDSELGKILLFGKRLINENQRFITYGFEGFRGSSSSLLTDFKAKYKQKDMEEKEKGLVSQFLQGKNSNYYSELLLNVQLLLFYILKKNCKESDTISSVIENMKAFVNISNQAKELFRKVNSLKVEVLLDVLSYLEYFSYKTVEENVIPELKEEIDDKTKKDILDYFEKNRNGKLFDKPHFATGVRKYVTRYLAGMRSDLTDINLEDNLFNYLSRDDLWSEEVNDDDRMGYEINEMLNKFKNVKCIHAVSLYNLLGRDDALFVKKAAAANPPQRGGGGGRGRGRPAV